MVDEDRQNQIEDLADEGNCVWDLLEMEYVDAAQATLRAMFKAYCTRMHSTKPNAKEQADHDLIIFTKSLMQSMYEAAGDIVDGRNE
jgi:hypothetical protein